MEFDLTPTIASFREKQVLDRPFETEKAYAVFTKNAIGQIVRIEFAACAGDLNQLGPKWEPTYWGIKLAKAAIEEPNPAKKSLNDIADYYLTRTGPTNEWDGKIFYDQNELFTRMPELKNAIPSFTVQVVTSKGGKKWFPDAPPGKEATEALEKQRTPFTRLPEPTAPNKL